MTGIARRSAGLCTSRTTNFIETCAATATHTAPQDPLDDPALDTALDAALKALPAAEYRLVELYYFQKLKLRQIADIMGCSVSKVSRHLDAVHNKLQGRLRPAFESG